MSSKIREKREVSSVSALSDSLFLCFLKEVNNAVYKSNIWFLLQSTYDNIFCPGKKVIPSQLNWTLHSPEIYFQGITCFETHFTLDRLCCQCQDSKTHTLFVRLPWTTQIQSLRFNTEGPSSEVVCSVPVAMQCSPHVDKYITCKGTLW